MKSNKGFAPLIIILVVLLGIGGLYFFKTNSSNKVISTPIASIAPTMVPEPSTENWKVFKDEAFQNEGYVYNAYQIRYPENCVKRDYKILDCILTNGKVTIILNAGGHGGGDDGVKVLSDNVSKKYSAGEGKFTEIELIAKKEVIGTFWFTKTDKVESYYIWGLEFYGASIKDLTELNIMLDKILNSVEFITK